MSKIIRRETGLVIGMFIGLAIGLAFLLGFSMVCEGASDLEPVDFFMAPENLDIHPSEGDLIPTLFMLNFTYTGDSQLDTNFSVNLSMNTTEGGWLPLHMTMHDAYFFPIQSGEFVEMPFDYFPQDGDNGYRQFKIWIDELNETNDDNPGNNNISLYRKILPPGPDVFISPVNETEEPYDITIPVKPICSPGPHNLTEIYIYVGNYGSQSGDSVIDVFYQKDGEIDKEQIARFPPEMGEMPIDPIPVMEISIPWDGLDERFNGTGKIIVEITCAADVNLSNNDPMEFPIEIIFGKDPTITDIKIDNNNPQEGDEVKITVDIANLGIVNITNEKDLSVFFYYQKGQKRKIGTAFVGNLNTHLWAEDSSKEITWVPKVGDAGNGKISAEILFEHFPKDDRTTNNLSTVLDITIDKGSPDFRIIDGSASKTSLGVGDNIKFNATIENIGSDWDGISNVKVEFYADDKNNPAFDNISLGSVDITSILNYQGTKEVDLTIPWPGSLPVGNEYYIIVKVDPDNDINEKKEDNNDFNTSESVEVRELRANLVFYPNEIVVSNAEPNQGENITITAMVKNSGNDDAGSFEVLILLDNNTLFTKQISSLAKGATSEISYYWLSKEKGPHTIDVIIDKDNEVFEWDDTDNSLTTGINVYEMIGEIYVHEPVVDNDAPEVDVEIEITVDIECVDSTDELSILFVDVNFYKNEIKEENMIGTMSLPKIDFKDTEDVLLKWNVDADTTFIWVEVNSEYAKIIGDSKNNSVQINVTTFAIFDLKNITTFPTTIKDGEDLDITVKVENTGTGPGDAKLVLYIDGTEETSVVEKNILAGDEKDVIILWMALEGQHDLSVEVLWNDDPNALDPPVVQDNITTSVTVNPQDGNGETKEIKIDLIELSKALPVAGDTVTITAKLDLPSDVNEEDINVKFQYRPEGGDWKDIGESNVKDGEASKGYTFTKAGKYDIKIIVTHKEDSITDTRTVTVQKKIKDEGGDSSFLIIIIIVVVIGVIGVGAFFMLRGGGTPPSTPPPQGPQPQQPMQQQQPQVKQVKMPKQP